MAKSSAPLLALAGGVALASNWKSLLSLSPKWALFRIGLGD